MIMRNTVILVQQIDEEIAAGLSMHDAIVEATVRRSRPVVLTALAAILAMIPLAQSLFWGPMAITIAGGLAGATLLTLLFLPALTAVWFRVKTVRPRAGDAGPDGGSRERRRRRAPARGGVTARPPTGAGSGGKRRPGAAGVGGGHRGLDERHAGKPVLDAGDHHIGRCGRAGPRGHDRFGRFGIERGEGLEIAFRVAGRQARHAPGRGRQRGRAARQDAGRLAEGENRSWFGCSCSNARPALVPKTRRVSAFSVPVAIWLAQSIPRAPPR